MKLHGLVVGELFAAVQTGELEVVVGGRFEAGKTKEFGIVVIMLSNVTLSTLRYEQTI